MYSSLHRLTAYCPLMVFTRSSHSFTNASGEDRSNFFFMDFFRTLFSFSMSMVLTHSQYILVKSSSFMSRGMGWMPLLAHASMTALKAGTGTLISPNLPRWWAYTESNLDGS